MLTQQPDALGYGRAMVKQSGTTLVEMLVGMAIFAILVSMALPGFMTWIQNTQLRTAAEATLNGLQIARGEAVRRNSQVTFTLTGNNWIVTDAAGATIQSRSGSEGSANAVINVAGTMPLTFNGLGRPSGTLAVVGGGDILRLSILNPTGGSCQASGGGMRCLEVRVTRGGQVRMCDPMRTLSDPHDPQAC